MILKRGSAKKFRCGFSGCCIEKNEPQRHREHGGKDFALRPAAVSVAAKGKTRVALHDIGRLCRSRREYPDLAHCIMVCLETHPRRTKEGIDHLTSRYAFLQNTRDGKEMHYFNPVPFFPPKVPGDHSYISDNLCFFTVFPLEIA